MSNFVARAHFGALLVLGIIGPAWAAVGPSVRRPPAGLPPAPELAVAAAEQQLPLGQLAGTDDTTEPRPGDEVTALVVLYEGDSTRQWLTDFRIATPTAAETAEHPDKNTSFKGGSGRIYEFAEGGALALDIMTIGPVTLGRAGTPEVKRTRAVMSPGLLGVGLDRSASALLRNAPAAAAPGLNPTTGTATPARTLSEADERAVIGFAPALLGLFQAVRKTPGLREILWRIAEKPSVWSIVKSVGRFDLGLSLGKDSAEWIERAPWSLQPGPLHRLSTELELNQRATLQFSLFVTAPRPPLLTTAGIVGIVAEPPGNPGKRLEIRVVGTRRAGGASVSRASSAVTPR